MQEVGLVFFGFDSEEKAGRVSRFVCTARCWGEGRERRRWFKGGEIGHGFRPYMCFAITSHATALTWWRSASHNSSSACRLNHRRHTSRQYMTQDLWSFPPASFAVMMTFFVMTGLFALVIFHSSSSQGMTCSIWYFRRSATRVTSAGGMAGSVYSLVLLGRTGKWISWSNWVGRVWGRGYVGGTPRARGGRGR